MADSFNPNNLFYGCEIAPTQTFSFNENNAAYYHAMKIVPKSSKTANSLIFINWSHVGTFQSCTVELRSDNSGNPSSTVLASGTVTPSSNFNSNKATISDYVVTAGTTYWIVVYSAGHSGTNSLEIRQINDPDNNIAPANFSVRTSTNSGGSWSDPGTTRVGCGGIGYTDGSFEGNGFSDFDTLSIGGTTSQYGEYFNPSVTFSANKIAFCVKKVDAGTPSSDLSYVIQNADTTTQIETGTLVTAASVSTTLTWYTVNLSSVRTFTAGVNYRVYLSTTATSGTRFQILDPKTINNATVNAMTFGGTTSSLTTSASQDTSKDVAFKLTKYSTGTTIFGDEGLIA